MHIKTDRYPAESTARVLIL